MKTSFTISATFKLSAKTLYNSWLDSNEHSAMTGGSANCSSEVGATFSAWDGYIFGKNIELIDGFKIKQTWRTTEFEDDDESSEIEIILEDKGKECELTLTHQNIPEGQPDYEQGWKDHYFTPMNDYFT